MSLFRRFNQSSTNNIDAEPPAAAAPTSRSHRTTYVCNNCQNPIPDSVSHIHVSRQSGERRYHRQCFVCLHCHKAIDPAKEKFCFNATTNDTGVRQEHPFHRHCFADYFGWTCVVCDQTLPVKRTVNGDNSSKQFEFLKHPFFEKERMCPHHALPHNRTANEDDSALAVAGSTDTTERGIGSIRRCSGCHRFEPISCPDKHFIDLGDSNTGRCVCLACCRTVVTTSQDAEPLWERVLDFFEFLGLITTAETVSGVSRQSMSSIPILIVGHDALNDNLKVYSDGVHYGSAQIMTRGLCLSEHSSTNAGSLGITAVMCLSGLPADLTASVLAHEATHVWIKLNPNFRYGKALPLKVEEGIAQLVAFLFLNDGLEPIVEETSEDDANPSDSKLRQYFKFCIETDQTLYGEGFRLAARAYAEMGMHELLYYVALNHDFPPCDIS